MSTDTWNGGNALWNTTGAWSAGLPNSSSDVVIGSGQPQITNAVGAVKVNTVSNSSVLDIENSGALTTVGLLTNNGTLYIDTINYGSTGSSLTVGGGLTNTGTIDLADNGPNGGDSLTVTGTLTNSGNLNIGNANLQSSTTVTLGGFTSTGSLSLIGNTSTGTSARATFNTGATAAPSALMSAIGIEGDALLQYASGAITSIGSSGALHLIYSDAQIDVAGNSSNDSALNLTSNAGIFDLENGATYTDANNFSNSGVIYIDTVNYGAEGSSLTISGNLTNTGTIDLADNGPNGNDSLTVTGTLTNNGAMNIGNAGLLASTNVTLGGYGGTGSINLTGNTSPGTSAKATLNLGSTVAPTTLTTSVSITGDAVIEYASGAIKTIASGGALHLTLADAQIDVVGNSGNDSALNLTSNAGVFDLENGATYTDANNLANSGTIYIDTVDYGAEGSSLTVQGNLNNTGAIHLADNGVTGADSLTVTGTLTNGGTLIIGSSSLQASTTATLGGYSGTGSINLTGNTSSGTSAKATLNLGSAVAPTNLTTSVSITGDALLEYASGAIKTIASGGGLRLVMPDAQIDVVGNSANDSALNLTSNAGTFDLENGATYTDANNLANSGTIYIDTENYGAQGSSLTVQGNLNNTGTISLADNGATGGDSLTVTGTLTNSGVMNIGSGGIQASTTVTLGAFNDTGTLTLVGDESLNTTYKVTLNAGSTAAPGTLSASIAIAGDALLEYASGAIKTIASGGELRLIESDAQIGVAGNSANDSALSLTSIAGTFDLENGATYTDANTLANSGTIYIDTVNYGAEGSSLTVQGDLNNTGTIELADNGATGDDSLTVTGTLTNSGAMTLGSISLQASINVTLDAFDDNGSLSLIGNEYGTTAKATLNAGATAAPTTFSATVVIAGNALLEYASGAITSIGSGGALHLYQSQAQIDIAGDSSNNSALDLTSNAGVFDLEGGATYSDANSLSNSGTIDIDALDYAAVGSSLTIGGSLTNTGTIDLATNYNTGNDSLTVTGVLTNSNVLNIGMSALQASTTATLGGLSNSGSLVLIGSSSGTANLDINGAVSNSGTLLVGDDSVFDVAGGAFTQTAGTTTVVGSFTDATINVDGGVFYVDTTSFTNTGRFSIVDGGEMTMAGGGLTNLSGTTLTGGTYSVGANSTLQLANNATIVTDNANIILTGANSTIDSYNTSTSSYVSIDSTLSTIAASGALSLLGGRNWTVTSGDAVTNDGVITLGGTTLTATASGTSLTDAAGSKLIGYGTVTATSFTNAGTIEANGGTLTISNAVAGSGALQIDANADLVVNGAIASGASATFSGDDAVLTLNSPSSFGATVGGFAFFDTIGLVGIVGNAAKVVSNQLIVSENGTTVATINLNGAYAGITFITQAMSGTTGTNVIALPTPATVADYLGAVSLYDSLPGGFSIADTAANVSAHLGSLNDAAINAITITDNNPIAVNVAEITSDATALAKTSNANASPYQLAVIDSGPNVTAGLTTLKNDNAHIASITLSSGAVNVSYATYQSDASLLDKIVGGFGITDSLTTIVSNLAALNANPEVVTLVATSGTGTLHNIQVKATTLQLKNSGTALTINENWTYTGKLTVGAGSSLILLSGEAATLKNVANLSGAIVGPGNLTTSGSTLTSASTTTISATQWISSKEVMNIGGALTFSGTFSGSNGDKLNSTGGSLTLTGATSFIGGTTIEGTSVLNLEGATTNVTNNLTIEGAGVLLTGDLTINSGNVTLGHGAGDAPVLTIASGAVFDMTDDHNISAAKGTTPMIVNDGTLEKTGGTTKSTFSAPITNNNTLEVTTATLAIGSAVTGTGTDIIGGPATLDITGSGSFGAGQTVDFTASGGELELLNPAAFKATIDGFDLGGLSHDTIVTNWLFQSAVINGTSGATITLDKGASTTTLNLAGNFSGGTFSHTASGGYTTIGFA